MSLRARLILYYTGFFAIALILLGGGVIFTVKSALERGVEGDLYAGTQQVRTIFNSGGLNKIITPSGEVLLLLRGDYTRVFDNPNLLAQVFAPRGELLGRSPNLEGHELALPDDILAEGLAQPELMITRSLNDGRVMSLITPLVLRNNGQLIGYLQISRSLNDVDRTLKLLLFIFLGGGAIVLFLTAAGATWLSRTALAPIDQVTRTAQSIARAEDLDQRVTVPRSQDELHRLTITINDLLARLEALFITQRRFVADVSHELRTPLAAMQGNLEVLARGGYKRPELLDESLADMRREVARLIRMVNDLLLLARSESGVQLRMEAVELDTLLLELHRELAPLAGEAALRIGAEDQISVRGDRDRLKQAVLNLGVNAIQHTAPGGLVTLSLERREGYACIAVADTGEGIEADDLPHIFERFYRADRARSRRKGGVGLGLSIVKRIVDAHNGEVTVASERGRGSTFAIWLPLEATSTESDAPATPPSYGDPAVA